MIKSGLNSLAARLAGVKIAAKAMPAEVVKLIPFNRDWRKKMEDVDTRLEEVQKRRSGYIAERQECLIESFDGDPAAHRKVLRLDRNLDDCDREIRALHDARAVIAGRLEAEGIAKADARERELRRLAYEEIEQFMNITTDTQKVVDTLVSKLSKIDGELKKLRVTTDHDTPAVSFHEVNEMKMRMTLQLKDALAKSGFEFNPKPFEDDRKSLTDCLPELSRLREAAYLKLAEQG